MRSIRKVWIARDRRVLSAELVPGEQIFARGRLERSDQAIASSAYRDVGWGWALRASAGQMLLSSEPLGGGMRQRAAFHRGWARIALGFLLATQLSVAWYYARLGGHTEVVPVTGAHHSESTDSDGDTHDHYTLEVRGESFDIDWGDFASLHEARGSRSASRAGATGRSVQPRPSPGGTASSSRSSRSWSWRGTGCAVAPRGRGSAARSTNRARADCPTADRARLLRCDPQAIEELGPQIGGAIGPGGIGPRLPRAGIWLVYHRRMTIPNVKRLHVMRNILAATLMTGCAGVVDGLGGSDSTGDVTTHAITGNDLSTLALANLGGTACGASSLGDHSFFSSCTGNGGQPEYWCADFARWVWENNGVDTSELSAAAGSFYVYGQHHNTLSNTPALGAAVVFDYGGNGYADHVAIVTQVNDDGTIETASGDWNGQSGSEADFSRTSHVILNSPAYGSTVGTTPGIIGMTISGFITPAGIDNGTSCGGSPAAVGAIDEKYVALGGCGSFLGAPVNPEAGTPDGVGRYSVFEHGSIYWTPKLGAWEVHGVIRDAWRDAGWEAGALGYPISDETGTPDGVGRYNVFEHGSIYWTAQLGAFGVLGRIRDAWAAAGWEAGALGYPISNEYAVTGGRASDFQHGTITWTQATDTTVTSLTMP